MRRFAFIILLAVSSGYSVHRIFDSLQVYLQANFDSSIYIRQAPPVSSPDSLLTFNSTTRKVGACAFPDSLGFADSTRAAHQADTAFNTPDSVRAASKADSLIGLNDTLTQIRSEIADTAATKAPLAHGVSATYFVVAADATSFEAGPAYRSGNNVIFQGNVGIGVSPTKEFEVTGSGNVYTNVKSPSGYNAVVELEETGGLLWQITNHGSSSNELRIGNTTNGLYMSIDSAADSATISGMLYIAGHGRTIASENLENGWLRVGTTLAIDPNEIAFKGGNSLIQMTDENDLYIAVDSGTYVVRFEGTNAQAYFYNAININSATANRMLTADASKDVVSSSWQDTSTGATKSYLKSDSTECGIYKSDDETDGTIALGWLQGSDYGPKLYLFGRTKPSDPDSGRVRIEKQTYDSIGLHTQGLKVTGNQWTTGNITADSVYADHFGTYGSTACSLFDGATFRATATCYWSLIGKQFMITLPELSGSVTASTTTYLRFATGTIPNPPTVTAHWVVWIVDGDEASKVVCLKYGGSTNFILALNSSSGYLTAGTVTFNETSIPMRVN